MKQYPADKILAVAGICLIGFLAFKSLKPVPQKAAPLATDEISKVTSTRDSQLRDTSTAIEPIQGPAPIEVLQTPKQNWQAQLSTLYGIGKLFGAGGEERMKLLQDFVETLEATNVPAAVKELQALQAQNPTETGQELRLRLLQKWGESDIRSAADWTLQLPSGNGRQDALGTLAGEWAGQNFNDAKTWAAQLSEVNERQSALENVADSAVYTDPLAALNLATTLTASPERDSAITRAAGVWARHAPDDAVAWAKQIPDAEVQALAIANIAVSWSEKNPVAGGTLAVSSLPAGPLQDKAVIGIVQRWATTDNSAAKAWVDQFPEGPLRETALKQF